MTKVRCSVDSCKFWGHGDICEAEAIWVKNNMRGDADDDLMAPHIELAAGLGEVKAHQQHSARTSAETCCETMRPRQ
jgi:hypothetical protein